MTRVTLSLTFGPLRLAHVVEHRSTIPPAAVETTAEEVSPSSHRPLAKCGPRLPESWRLLAGGGR